MNVFPKDASVTVVLLVLVLAELTCAFEAAMIYAALSRLHQIYGDPVSVGWLITSFLLVSAGAAAVCSRLGDLYGRRRLLLIMLAFAAIGSLISVLAESLPWIIAGRAVQGASAAILPLCFGLIQERLPKQRIPLGIGIVAGTATFGAGLGYAVGGAVVDAFAWQSIFSISLAMALLAMAAVWLFLPALAHPRRETRLDLVGGVLFVPAIAGLLFALTRVPYWGWLDGRTLGWLLGSLAVLLFWIRHELRHPEPLIDIRLLARKEILVANLCFAMVAFGAFQTPMILLPVMQQPTWTLIGLGASATIAGALNGLIALCGAAGSGFGGYLTGRFGGRRVVLCGAALITAAYTLFMVHQSPLGFVIVIAMVGALGMTAIYAAVPTIIVQVAPPERVSEATGMSSVVRALFGALGAQAIAAALASSTLPDPAGGGGFPSAQAFILAIGLVAGSALCCWLAAWMLPGRQKQSGHNNPSLAVNASH